MYVDGLDPELLLNREATLSITKVLASTCYPDKRFEELGLKRMNATLNWLWENNVEIIFNHSESPIEKIFLNIFNLYCLEARFSLVVHTTPLKSTSNDVTTFIHNFRHTMKIWRQFQKETHIQEPGAFLNFIKTKEIDEELQKIIRQHVLVERLVFDYFHISIKSTLDEFQFQGKNIQPDIFIWMPAKPDFKMIVECDEYDDHSDKQSFTADRARDRVLWRKGFQVLRFSADEIYNDCVAKAKELRDYLLSTYHERLFTNGEEPHIFEDAE